MAHELLESDRTMLPIRRRLRAARGFTLVELAVVVVIVGILAVVAVVGYRKLINSSKVTEAQNVVQSIRVAQEAFRAETGVYADIGTSTYCPNTAPNGKVITQWDPNCNGGTTTWAKLPVHVDGAVHFGYKTWSGTTTPVAAGAATWVDWSKAPANRPWFIVYAASDLDPADALLTEAVGSNLFNQVVTRNEGY
jgi:type IV pilus assembly protein PilA